MGYLYFSYQRHKHGGTEVACEEVRVLVKPELKSSLTDAELLQWLGAMKIKRSVNYGGLTQRLGQQPWGGVPNRCPDRVQMAHYKGY